MRHIFRTFLAASILSFPAHAAPKLGLPIQCKLGEDCFIQQYVDVDSEGDSYNDYMCGNLSYDVHKGTDFALLNFAQTKKHVPVIASADGIVQGIRDGEEDGVLNKYGRDAVQNKECGNGVRIQHEDNWSTQYCHLLKGSVKVKKGQLINKGEVLGYVGMSGLAQFPHVHIGVEHQNQLVDPFVGGNLDSYNCHTGIKQPMWDSTPEYHATGIVQGGFSDAIPTYEQVKEGLGISATLPLSSKLMAFWTELYGTRKDDIIYMAIISPENDVLAYNKQTIEKKRARDFRFIGKKFETTRLLPGTYTGHLRLMRGKEMILDKKWLIKVS